MATGRHVGKVVNLRTNSTSRCIFTLRQTTDGVEMLLATQPTTSVYIMPTDHFSVFASIRPDTEVPPIAKLTTSKAVIANVNSTERIRRPIHSYHRAVTCYQKAKAADTAQARPLPSSR